MPFPITIWEISKTEKELKVKFPKSFIEKMIINNWWELLWNYIGWELIPFKNSESKKTIIRTCNDIIREYKLAMEWEGFSKEYIPFAYDWMGNYLIFKKTENWVLENNIFFWDHETWLIKKISDDFQNL